MALQKLKCSCFKKEKNQFLIISDLDGTLLNNQGEIGEYTMKVVQKISELGHLFCIATGRPEASSLEIYKKLNLNTIMVNLNGSVFSNPSEPKYLRFEIGFNKKILEKIINEGELIDNVNNIIIESNERQFFLKRFDDQKKDWIIKEWLHVNEKKHPVVYGRESFINWETDLNTIIINVFDETKIDYVISTLKTLNPTINVNYWTLENMGAIIEIKSKFCNKGNALDIISAYYGIPQEKIMAFGDSHNDIELLQKARFSYAMKNASSTAKSVSRRILEFNNNEEGVAKELNFWLETDKFDQTQ